MVTGRCEWSNHENPWKPLGLEAKPKESPKKKLNPPKIP